MKKILIVAYILSTLLISGFARASEVHKVAIQDIVFAEGSWKIGVSGQLSSPCLTGPVARLTSELNKNVFVLSMIAEQKGDLCIAVVGPVYNTKVDLRKLVIESGIQLEPEQEYIIRADGHDFEVAFTGEELLIALPYNPVELL